MGCFLSKEDQTVESSLSKEDQTVESSMSEEDQTAESTSKSILGKPFEDMKLHYTLGKELGRGGSAVVYQCIEISTGRSYACKSILKRRLNGEYVPENLWRSKFLKELGGKQLDESDEEDVRREIQILQHLRGQPGIAEFKEAYEDEESVHLVMELCAGGELFDRIIAKGHYSEKEAASVFRSIVKIIHSCHSMGVMHRDIKPENFLLSGNDDAAVIKAIDFGLSDFIEEGKVYKDIVGSAYYIAPEVIRRNYGKEADIWSAGVVLYILLSGAPPFWAETEQGILRAVLVGRLDLECSPWPSISKSAKDLIEKMLTMDPKQRISLSQILEHPWLREGEGGEASDKPIDYIVISRFKENRLQSKRLRWN